MQMGKSEEIIDCHHQDSNQGPSLEASDALTTELGFLTQTLPAASVDVVGSWPF